MRLVAAAVCLSLTAVALAVLAPPAAAAAICTAATSSSCPDVVCVGHNQYGWQSCYPGIDCLDFRECCSPSWCEPATAGPDQSVVCFGWSETCPGAMCVTTLHGEQTCFNCACKPLESAPPAAPTTTQLVCVGYTDACPGVFCVVDPLAYDGRACFNCACYPAQFEARVALADLLA